MTRLSSVFVAILTLLPLLSSGGCNTAKPQLQDEYTRAGLSDALTAIVNDSRQAVPQLMLDADIPGLSLALVDRDGILWAAGFGHSDSGTTPMTTETLSAACSFTKVFTGTAVMLAVQDGLVDLDVPIIEYVPDFSVNSRFEDDPHKKITLRHLLTHSSGLPHDTVVGNLYEAEASFEAHIESVSSVWLKHKVGERQGYSNVGMNLVAHVLQVQTGKPFAEYLREAIFEPLKMSDTWADLETIESHPNRAAPHMPHVKVSMGLIDFYRGAGSVFTNAKDFARFVQFHLNRGKVDGDTILAGKFLDMMYTASALDTNPWPDYRIDYGLGVWIVTTLNDGNHKVGHDGAGAGFTSLGWWYPEYGLGGLVLARSPESSLTQEKAWLDGALRRILTEKLIGRNEDFDTVPWRTKWCNCSPNDSVYDPDTFTPYQPAWKKYTGTYRYRWKGHELKTYARVLIALFGLPPVEVKVREEEGYLAIIEGGVQSSDRLDEHQPGLFFTKYGDCLDLRGKSPTWKSYRLKKIK